MDLIANPYARFEDKADPKIPTATLQIYDKINENSKREESANVLRASAATMCVLRRWYQNQGLKGETLSPRKIVNFMLGDLSEMVLLHFVKEGCVGPGKLYSEVQCGQVSGNFKIQQGTITINTYYQKDLHLQINDKEVIGHGDAFGKRNSDGAWEYIECKSAANWGFKSFQDAGPGDYIKQAHAIMMTREARNLEIKHTRFFYLRKETGHVWDKLVDFNPRIGAVIQKEFLDSVGAAKPPKPFHLVDETFRKKTTGRKIAEFPCTYCPYLENCHGKHEIDWKSDQWGNMKPIYVFRG